VEYLNGRVGPGYTGPSASNRFIRTTEDGLGVVLDVLAPAWARIVSTQPYGDIWLDEIRGQSLALDSPGEQIGLTVTRLHSASVSFTVAIPDITPALCLKAVGWCDRLTNDAVDVWRLLRGHRRRLLEPIAWRDSGVGATPVSAGAKGWGFVAVLRRDFARPAGVGACGLLGASRPG
jgi:hypothetical protein